MKVKESLPNILHLPEMEKKAEYILTTLGREAHMCLLFITQHLKQQAAWESLHPKLSPLLPSKKGKGGRRSPHILSNHVVESSHAELPSFWNFPYTQQEKCNGRQPAHLGRRQSSTPPILNEELSLKIREWEINRPTVKDWTDQEVSN